MKLILCIDKSGGMLFNSRRQSQDSLLREKILSLLGGKKLCLNEYSARQFEDTSPLYISEDFLLQAGKEDFCFVENTEIPENAVDAVYLFHWNRAYPADTYFTMELKTNFKKVHTEHFEGSSHKKITLEIYERRG